MFTRRIVLLTLALITMLTLGACTWTIERNDDGSWKVTGQITQDEVQEIIDDSLSDPLISDLQTDFHPGYIDVTANRTDPDSGATEGMTFRIEMSVVDDHLGVTISDAVLGGTPVHPDYVDAWNQRMANKLERAGKRNPNSALQEVTITEDDVTMVWRVESLKSRKSS